MERILQSVPPAHQTGVRDLIRSLADVPAGIVVCGLEAQILFLSPRILNALGHREEDLQGRPIEVLFAETTSPHEVEAIREATFAGGWTGEILCSRREGTPIPVHLETSLARDRDGTPIGVVAVARDISDEQAFQERLLQEARFGTLGLIAHNVAHEVRNHLSAIKMSLYMLHDLVGANREGDVHFSIAREEMQGIELYLENLEANVDPPQPAFGPVPLIEAVELGLEEARPILVPKSISLLRQYPPAPPTLHLDREQISRAVTQVVQNASEAMDVGGEIHVVVKPQSLPEGRWWLVEIRDNGKGVSPEHRARVFDPFFTTSRHQLGLGLSNVNRILKAHGGTATLACPSTGGVVVSLKLPDPERRG